jgi:pimeloyl-ACP methyl ester carboxylesterase
MSANGLFGLRLGGDPADPPRTLLLHGFAGGAADWRPVWTSDEPALALDLPGHGASHDPSGHWDAAIERLIEALPPSIDRVIGHALGGRIALGMLRSAPRRFGHVLVVSARTGVSHPTERIVRRATDLCWIELIRRDQVAGWVCPEETLPLHRYPARSAVAASAHRRVRRRPHRAEGLIACLDVFGLGAMPDTRKDLRSFPGELSWIVGAEDHECCAIADQVTALRPRTRSVRLSGVGEDVLLEAPGELGSLILGFAANDGKATGRPPPRE